MFLWWFLGPGIVHVAYWLHQLQIKLGTLLGPLLTEDVLFCDVSLLRQIAKGAPIRTSYCNPIFAYNNPPVLL